MNAIGSVLVYNILPIFLVAACGYLLRRWTRTDVQIISRITFYVFSPALMFASLVNSTIDAAELGALTLVAGATILAVGAVAWGVGRLLRLDRVAMTVLILAAMFGNVGNLGLPLNQLRYGAEGLSRAIPFMTISGMLVYTLGVLIASLGRSSWRDALARLVRLPIIYAVGGALLFYFTPLTVPRPLMSAIDIAATGSIPVMLLVLGMQIAEVTRLEEIRIALPATALRLIVSPLIAVIIASAVGLEGLNRAVTLLQSAVPVAVATTILAIEFDVMPKAMTTTVVLSTLLSPLTLALLIQLLGL